MRRPQLIKQLLTLTVLVSLCSALFVTSAEKAKAAPAANVLGKISPDLKQLLDSGEGGRRVKLIVQTTPNTQALISNLLQTVGGVVNGLLLALNIRIVDATLNSVNVIAADPNVTYVSLDAPVRSSGHVTTTTGAQQVRGQNTLLGPQVVDCSGVTIAVIDSGIDAQHKSFSSPGKTKFSKDFTGQNRTDDPWGHGHTSLRSLPAKARRLTEPSKALRPVQASLSFAFLIQKESAALPVC